MIANYGYEDGSGQYFISISSDACVTCREKPCVKACEQQVLLVEKDDWGDDVVVVDEGKRLSLSELCDACKHGARAKEPCLAACQLSAIGHSW